MVTYRPSVRLNTFWLTYLAAIARFYMFCLDRAVADYRRLVSPGQKSFAEVYGGHLTHFGDGPCGYPFMGLLGRFIYKHGRLGCQSIT